MEFKLIQTVNNGVSSYNSPEQEQPSYFAETKLSFGGLSVLLTKDGTESSTLLFDKKLPFSERFKHRLPKDMFGLKIYQSQARVGSVKFRRKAWFGRLTFMLMINKRVFEAFEFTTWSDACSIYLYEDGKLCGRVWRERHIHDDKTIYNIWVNDTDYVREFREEQEKLRLEYEVETMTASADPLPEAEFDPYSIPELRFLADSFAAFTVFYDIVRKKPFGEYTYSYNHNTGHGIRNIFLRRKTEKAYDLILNPPPPPPEIPEETPPSEEELAQQAALESSETSSESTLETEKEQAQNESAAELEPAAQEADKEQKAPQDALEGDKSTAAAPSAPKKIEQLKAFFQKIGGAIASLWKRIFAKRQNKPVADSEVGAPAEAEQAAPQPKTRSKVKKTPLKANQTASKSTQETASEESDTHSEE